MSALYTVMPDRLGDAKRVYVAHASCYNWVSESIKVILRRRRILFAVFVARMAFGGLVGGAVSVGGRE